MARRSGTSFTSGFYLGLIDDVTPGLKKIGKNYERGLKRLKSLNGGMQKSLLGMFSKVPLGGAGVKASRTPAVVTFPAFTKRFFPVLLNIRSHLNGIRTIAKAVAKNTSLNSARRNGAILARQIARASRGSNAALGGGSGNSTPPSPPPGAGAGGGGGPGGLGPGGPNPTGPGGEPLTWAVIGHGISELVDIVGRLSHTVGFGERSTNIGQRFGQTFSQAQNSMVAAQINSSDGRFFTPSARTDSIMQAMNSMNRSASGSGDFAKITGIAALIDEANDLTGETAKAASAMMKIGINGVQASESMASLSNTIRDAKLDVEFSDVMAATMVYAKALRAVGSDQKKNSKAMRDLTHAYVAFDHVLADSGFIDALMESSRDPTRAITTAAMFDVDPNDFIENPAAILKAPAFKDMLENISKAGGPMMRLQAAQMYAQATGMDAHSLFSLSSGSNMTDIFKVVDTLDKRKSDASSVDALRKRQVGAEDYVTAGGRFMGSAMNQTGLSGLVNFMHQISLGDIIGAAGALSLVGKGITFIGKAFWNVLKITPLIGTLGRLLTVGASWAGTLPVIGKGVSWVGKALTFAVPSLMSFVGLAPVAATAATSMGAALAGFGTWFLGAAMAIVGGLSAIAVEAIPALAIFGAFTLIVAAALRLANPFFETIVSAIPAVTDLFKAFDVPTLFMLGPALTAAGLGFAAFAASFSAGLGVLTAASSVNSFLSFFGLTDRDPLGALADRLTRLAAAANTLKNVPSTLTIPVPTVSGDVGAASKSLDAVEALYARMGKLQGQARLVNTGSPVIAPSELKIIIDQTIIEYGDKVVELLTRIATNTVQAKGGVTASIARGKT